jgi:predicted nucleic acid-binding protein
MRLVADTSIIFSIFKSSSFTRKMLSAYKLELFAPKQLFEELKKYSETICLKSKITKEKFQENLELLKYVISQKQTEPYFEEITKKSISHKEDAVFLALAMEMKIPLWSNDAHFKEQNLVKVFTTKELYEFLKSKIG